MTNPPTNHTWNDQSLHLIAELPFHSVIDAAHDPDGLPDEVWLWRSPDNSCEHKDGGLGCCDTVTGIYYGTRSPYEPTFCPRHFYALHYEPHAAYHLVDNAAEAAA
jgi:hypothetical protein